MASCVTYPAVPPVPGIPARVLLQDVAAWDAGAVGGDDTDGNLELRLSGVPQCAGAVIGLAATEMVTAPAQLSHAFYFHTGADGMPLVSAMENGIARARLSGYTLDTEFVLQRIEGVVRLLLDGSVRFTFRSASTGPIHVGCALYATGDALPSETPANASFWRNLSSGLTQSGTAPGPDPGGNVMPFPTLPQLDLSDLGNVTLEAVVGVDDPYDERYPPEDFDLEVSNAGSSCTISATFQNATGNGTSTRLVCLATARLAFDTKILALSLGGIDFDFDSTPIGPSAAPTARIAWYGVEGEDDDGNGVWESSSGVILGKTGSDSGALDPSGVMPGDLPAVMATAREPVNWGRLFVQLNQGFNTGGPVSGSLTLSGLKGSVPDRVDYTGNTSARLGWSNDEHVLVDDGQSWLPDGLVWGEEFVFIFEDISVEALTASFDLAANTYRQPSIYIEPANPDFGTTGELAGTIYQGEFNWPVRLVLVETA